MDVVSEVKENQLVNEETGLSNNQTNLQTALERTRNLRKYFEELDDGISGVDELRTNADSMLEQLEIMLKNLGSTLQDNDVESIAVDDLDQEWEEVPEFLDDTSTDIGDEDLDAEDTELNADVDAVNEFSDIALEEVLDKKLARIGEERPLIAPSTPANVSIKFAPGEKPVTGTLNVCFIDVKWNNKNGIGVGKIKTMANAVKKIYKDLSGGQLILNMTVKSVKVPFNHARKNLYPATNRVKNAVNAASKGTKYDIYGIVHNNVRPYSNAGGNTVYLENALIRTCLHELGHLNPLNLEHAGKYITRQGKTSLDAYGDVTGSFMSRGGVQTLNAPQRYHLGWLAKNKVAQHELTDGTKEYVIEKIGAKKPSDKLKGVLIPSEGRDLFLSIDAVKGKNVFMLHYRNGGGSQLAKQFAKETEYKGLVFTRTKVDGNSARIRISALS